MSRPMTDQQAMDILNSNIFGIDLAQVDEAWQVAIDGEYVKWSLDCRYTPQAQRMVDADRCQKKTQTWVIVEGRDITDGHTIREVYTFDSITEANREAFAQEAEVTHEVAVTVTQDEEEVERFMEYGGGKSVSKDTEILFCLISSGQVFDGHPEEWSDEHFLKAARENGTVIEGLAAWQSAFNNEQVGETDNFLRIIQK